MSLNSKMTAIADNIRSFTGKTEKLNLDEMALSINEVYEEGKKSFVDSGELCQTIRFNNLNLFNKKEVVLNLDNVTDLQKLHYTYNNGGVGNTTVEKLTVNCKKPIIDMYKAFNGEISTKDKTLKTIILNIDTSQNTNFNNCFNGMEALETIGGTPLDFTSCKNTNIPFRYCNSLVNVRFVENTITTNFDNSLAPKLSKETIESFVKGLSDEASGKTLSFALSTVNEAFRTSKTIELNKITTHESWGNYLFYVNEGVYFDQPTHISGSVTFKSMLDNLDYTCDFDISNVSENGNEIQINENLSLLIHYFTGFDGLHNFSAILVEPRYNGSYVGRIVGGSITIQATSNAQWQALVASKSNWTISLK